jgi:Tfp pilus assembly protein FimT
MHSIAGHFTLLSLLISLAVLALIVIRLSMFLRWADGARMVPKSWTSWLYDKTSKKTPR